MTTTMTVGVHGPATGGNIDPIPFSRLLRVELRKTVDTRAARWLLGGALIALLLAAVGGLAAQAAVAVERAAGHDVTSDFGRDWPRIVGYLVFVLLISLIGMAFGALVHNTAAAIVAFFAVGGLANLFSLGALRGVGRWVNTGEIYGWVLDGKWSGHSAQIVVASALWIVLPFALGAARTVRGEVR